MSETALQYDLTLLTDSERQPLALDINEHITYIVQMKKKDNKGNRKVFYSSHKNDFSDV